METTMQKQPRVYLSDKGKQIIVDIITYLFVILFMYTASSKFLTMKDFIDKLQHFPVIGKYNLLIAYLIPISEIIVSILLVLPKTVSLGLKGSLVLMIAFTIYLVYIVSTTKYLPCTCGGVISQLQWKGHIVLNSCFIVLAILGIILNKKNI